MVPVSSMSTKSVSCVAHDRAPRRRISARRRERSKTCTDHRRRAVIESSEFEVVTNDRTHCDENTARTFSLVSTRPGGTHDDAGVVDETMVAVIILGVDATSASTRER